jgi:hypothetical protein
MSNDRNFVCFANLRDFVDLLVQTKQEVGGCLSFGQKNRHQSRFFGYLADGS